MNFTKDVEISIELLYKLKDFKEPIKVAYFVDELKTTQAYLDQIVNRLKKGGLLKVKRGPNGGIYRASMNPYSIALIQKVLNRGLQTSELTYTNKIMTKIQELLNNESC
jgi:DNA-binding IscR family transcriptional regulator